MCSPASFRRLLLRTAVVLPLCTLVVCYAVGQPQWPMIHPSAVFDYGTPRVIASLGFSLSAPFMAAFGTMRYVRDMAVRDDEQAILRGCAFFCVVAGLLGVAAVPWHVSHAAHTTCAITFFASAALDIVLQHGAAGRRSPGRSCSNAPAVAAARLIALLLCLASVAGQVTQNHPLMGVGECGFAASYLIVLCIEEQELEHVGVQLLPSERAGNERANALLRDGQPSE
jgi:hypothetical protein